MTKAVLAAAIVLTLTGAQAAEASQWSLHWTGPRGGVYEGAGSCENGACKNSGTFTGPLGGVWRHEGAAHQTAPGQWAGEGTVTGPGGQTLKHNWTWTKGGS